MDDVGWSALLSVLCVFAAMFFSIISFAVRDFSKVKVQDAFEVRKKELLAEKFFSDTEIIFWCSSFISAVLNMLIPFLLIKFYGSFMGSLEKIVAWAFITAVLQFFILQVVIAKVWAKYSGEVLLAYTYQLLRILSYIVKPFMPILNLHDVIVRRLSGVAETTAAEVAEEKQEELLSVVEQGKIEGIVDDEQQEMIEHVLELNDTDVENIMTPRTDVVAIDSKSSIDEIVELIKSEGHSRIPVYHGTIDNITGLLYAKDLLNQIGSNPADFKMKDIIREAYFVPETKTLRELLGEFKIRKLHIAIVLDEYGGTAGIVTIEDIIEEVLGEIADEYEPAQPESLAMIDENTVEVDARMYIDDFNSEFDVELPEDEDYDTLGGFVFSHLGYIPKNGQKFDYENLQITITNAGKRRVNRLKIQKFINRQHIKH